jgi:hypothetical protein
MREDYFEKVTKSATTMLSRWDGSAALVRELTVSHRSISIVLFADRATMRRRNLMIHADPLWMRRPVRVGGVGASRRHRCGFRGRSGERPAVPPARSRRLRVAVGLARSQGERGTQVGPALTPERTPARVAESAGLDDKQHWPPTCFEEKQATSPLLLPLRPRL